MREEKLEFAEFLAMSKKARLEEFGYWLQKDFAKDKSLTEKTLCEWKREPKFQKYQRDLIRKTAGDSLADVIDSIKIRALEGETAAAKLYLEYARELVKQTEITVSNDDLEVFQLEIIRIIKKHVTDAVILNKIAKDIDDLEM